MRKPRSNPAKATKATSGAQKPHPRRTAHSSLPDFIPPALCILVPQPPKSADWVHEIKLDGWRLQVRVEDGSATIRTRNGHDYTHIFPELARDARGLDDCILDGELCAIDANGITDFAGLQSAMKAMRTSELVYFAFDFLFLGRQDLRSHSLLERQAKLLAFLKQQAPTGAIHYLGHLDASGSRVLERACEMKLEGIVSKRSTEPYVSGRTGSWTKAKCRAGQHAIVGGWTISDKGFSGLLLGIWKGKKLVPIGRVGTGFPDKLLRWLVPRLKELETSASPFSAPIPRKPRREIHYIKPELIAEVEFTSWTSDPVLRQASLQEVFERTAKGKRLDWINLPEGMDT
jgi:bifunctional non-homologous end joining protein LigD